MGRVLTCEEGSEDGQWEVVEGTEGEGEERKDVMLVLLEFEFEQGEVRSPSTTARVPPMASLPVNT